MIRVMISDPDLFAREGIKRMLENERDVQVACEAQNESETLEALRKYQPDVCILEIEVGNQHGLNFVRETKTQSPSTPILVMGHHHERDFALRAIRAGAAGYLGKNCTDQQLATAVRTTVRAVRIADAIVRRGAGDYAATPESWPWASGAQPIPGTRIGETGQPRTHGGAE